MIDLEEALAVAKHAVARAGTVALPYWRQGVAVETKADRSPVTAADREAEAEILQIIHDRYPDHSVLAEESGAQALDARYRWIVDPIDGTRGFTRGGQFWGSLVALEADGEIVVGVLAMPALGQTYWAARGFGCWCNDQRRRVSTTAQWRDATVSLGELGPLLSPPHGDALRNLIRTAALGRAYGDVAGCAMVLDGLADVWIESGVKPWDLAPSRILIEEAGGRFSNFEGGTSLNLGNAIGSNGLLHEHVLRSLQLQQ